MANIDSIARILLSHGETFHGGRANEIAEEWDAYGFDSRQVDEWCEIGVWDACTANELVVAGMRPCDVQAASAAMLESHGADVYTLGCPIYAVCNGDLSVRKMAKAWKAMQAE